MFMGLKILVSVIRFRPGHFLARFNCRNKITDSFCRHGRNRSAAAVTEISAIVWTAAQHDYQVARGRRSRAVLLIPPAIITGVLSDRLSRRNEAVAESIGTNSDSISYSFRVTADGFVERGIIAPNRFAGLVVNR
jgi:hypothetical protein